LRPRHATADRKILKSLIETLLRQALNALSSQIGDSVSVNLESLGPAVERTRDPTHGDFASNIAMQLAKLSRESPVSSRRRSPARCPERSHRACRDRGPGFINFHLAPQAYHEELARVLELGERYGRSELGGGERVIVEFVSANPTGPLHVGHGRHAAFGATLANLLDAAGFSVHREYYINDAGPADGHPRVSVWLRYLERCGERFAFPTNGYRGDYLLPIAAQLEQLAGRALARPAAEVFAGLPPDAPAGDKDVYIDAVIERARALLGPDGFRQAFDVGLKDILADIRDDLAEFGVVFDRWFSERSLTDDGAIERALERLRRNGVVYEKDGAQWFRATDFGDEKDRVVVRENGLKTYFAVGHRVSPREARAGLLEADRRARRRSPRLHRARARWSRRDGRAR
jgi:arginyl-tRNA synthetase